MKFCNTMDERFESPLNNSKVFQDSKSTERDCRNARNANFGTTFPDAPFGVPLDDHGNYIILKFSGFFLFQC